LTFAACVLAGLATGGCVGNDGSGEKKARITVVATTGLVADLARNVGGSRARIEALLRRGVDPHDYQPRPSEVKTLSEADVVLRSGGDVDRWLGELLRSAGSAGPAEDLIGAVRVRHDAGGRPDPHWWQDPRNARLAVARVRAALTRADPAGRETYAANAAGYLGRLRRLDREVARCLGRVPRTKRKLVTTHDSLGYYADRYGLEVIGALIPSLSSQAQPSAGDTQRLIAQIRRQRVEAVFSESALDPRLERAVARESGAEMGGTLWADSLGPPGSNADTYLRALAANTATIVEGLTGGRVSCRPRG